MQRHWVAVVGPDRFATERAYARDTLDLNVGRADEGEPVALVAATDPPVLFGIGVARPDGVRYTHRLFDASPALDRSVAPALSVAPAPSVAPGLTEISADDFRALTAGVGAERRVDADRSEWFVMVALPIEAGSRAEAVREFWTYVDKLGPTELPAFVWPRGQELAMQAFLLGERVNLDPEEDESDDAR
jgi:hypothetical protein